MDSRTIYPPRPNALPGEVIMNWLFPSKWVSAFAIVLAGVFCGCNRNDSKPLSPLEFAGTQLAVIPVQPGEVVMADRQAPVRLVDSPCTVPVLQGVERYADVAWVAPEFFAVRTQINPDGYELTTLPSGLKRFTARFRSPRSEYEARELFRGDRREHERILFCNVPATLEALREIQRDPERAPGPGIARLAVWPTNGIRASMQLTGKREMTVDLSNWQVSQELIVSAILDRRDASLLEQKLQSGLGQPIQFDVFTAWRRSGCVQSIRLLGVTMSGLRDGETGAVPLAEIKRAVRQTVAGSTKVDVDGECGAYNVGAPITQEDTGRTLSCRRTSDSLICRYEGEFQNLPAVYTTYSAVFSGARPTPSELLLPD